MYVVASYHAGNSETSDQTQTDVRVLRSLRRATHSCSFRLASREKQPTADEKRASAACGGEGHRGYVDNVV